MLWFLAQYGPDSVLGWLVLIFVAGAPVLALTALIVALVVAIGRATICRASPSEKPATASPDPEATAAYLSARARERRAEPRDDDHSG
jgi:hypothetical protein